MIVLDTNVISELMRPHPYSHVIEFVDALSDEQVATTSVSVQELSFGIELLGATHRARVLREQFEKLLDGRLRMVLPLTAYSARLTAVALVQRQRAGRPVSTTDAQIAGIAIEHGAILATRNARDFAGMPLEVVDPWHG